MPVSPMNVSFSDEVNELVQNQDNELGLYTSRESSRVPVFNDMRLATA